MTRFNETRKKKFVTRFISCNKQKYEIRKDRDLISMYRINYITFNYIMYKNLARNDLFS